MKSIQLRIAASIPVLCLYCFCSMSCGPRVVCENDIQVNTIILEIKQSSNKYKCFYYLSKNVPYVDDVYFVDSCHKHKIGDDLK